MLLPLPEASLLGFDLLSESPAELFLFLLELRVVELLHFALTILACLHLLLAVVLVVTLFSSRDKVEHEGANKEGAELAEVAMILVFHWASMSIPFIMNHKEKPTLGNTPEIFTTLDNATIKGLDVLSGADDREWHSSSKDARMLSTGLIIGLNGRLVYANILCGNDVADLPTLYVKSR